MSKQPFFFFGCWNKDPCDAGVENQIDYRQMVIEHLASNQDLFQFGIIAGDNIYPRKESTKAKTYYQETLNRGKGLLNQIENTKKKHIVLGNHNVAHENIRKAEENIFNTTETSLFTLYTQIATPVTSDNYNFIFLNTNLITPALDVVSALTTAFSKFKHHNNPYFVVGHDPLVAAKRKDGQNFVYIHSFHEIVEFLFERIQEGKKIAYLCADVHNFQAITIRKNNSVLPIIVSGTGGADPDLDIFDAQFTLSPITISHTTCKNTCHQAAAQADKYEIKVVMKERPYGYCIIDGTNVTYHTFREHLSSEHPKVNQPETSVGFLQVQTNTLDSPETMGKYLPNCEMTEELYKKQKGGKPKPRRYQR